MPCCAIERVGPRADRGIGPTLPVGEVVPALVAGAGPVGELVPGVAVRLEQRVGEAVGAGGSVLVLGRACGFTPPASTRGRREVIAGRAGESLGVRVVQGQGIRRDVVGLQ